MELRFTIGLEEPLLANGVKQVISKQAGFSLGEPCLSFFDVLLDMQNKHSNFVILDPDLKHFDPQKDIHQIKSINPNTKLVLICKNPGKAIYSKLLDQGYDGLILSCCSEDEILRAIQKIVDGDQFICSSITNFQKHQSSTLSKLSVSEREIEVIREMSYGKSSKEISESLNLSYHTIITHRKNIFKKFEVNSAIELNRRIQELDLYLYD